MKRTIRIPSVRSRQGGVALVVTLSLIVLLTIVVVAFFSHATADRAIEASRSHQTEARLLSESARNYVVGQFLEEIWDHSVDPGAKDFRPETNERIAPERLISPAISGANEDYANLIRQSTPGADPNTSAHGSGEPAANGRQIGPERWNQPVLLGGGGFSADGSGLPNWIYVTPDGISPTPSREAIGRFSYNVYDIGGLLNINTAGYRPGMDATEMKGALPGVDLTVVDPDLDLINLVDQRNPDYGANSSDFRDYVSAAGRNGFLSPIALQSNPARTFTSNYFVSRQDLLRYARVRNSTFDQNSLPFLTHFSRSISAPSWTPVGQELEQFPGAGQTTLTHYGDDGLPVNYTVEAGAPVLQRRFSLGKLAWLTPRGPGGNISPAAIQACFGLLWNPTEERWDYVGASGSSLASSIDTLAQVGAAGREPNFFEMLKAGILDGSLGVEAQLKTLAGIENQPLERDKDHQVLRIGANIIDCADPDNFPTRIAREFGGRTVEVAGVEDLPYLSSLLVASLRDGVSGPAPNQVTIEKCDLVLIPHFFNPHRIPMGGAAVEGPGRIVTEVYSGAISEVQVGQKSNPMSQAGVNKDLVTGETIAIQASEFENYRGSPEVATAGGSRLDQHVPWVTSSGSIQVFPMFSYEKNALTPPPYQTAALTTQRTYFSEDLGIRLQYETPGGQLKTYATISGNEAIGGSGVDGYAGAAGGPLQFDNGPGFSRFRILGTGNDRWHNITLWDPRTNRLGPSQGYTAVVSENPAVAGPSNFQRRALPAPTSDGTIGNYNGGLVVETLLGEWPEGGKSAANGRSDKSLTNITDPDGSYRPADAWLGPDANPYRNLGDARRRPIVLQRSFRTVGELGYVFRDVPWKTLSFFDESSGDAGLLDFFSVNDEAALTDGRVAMNTRNAVVLQALIEGIGRNPDGTDGVSLAASAAIADELRNNAFLDGDALPTIPQNVADVAKLLTKDRLASLTETIKSRREFVARALAGSVQTRTWNIFIDTVAQIGTFPPGTGTAGSDFIVEAEDRKWNSVAIDRFLGSVVASQEESVNE